MGPTLQYWMCKNVAIAYTTMQLCAESNTPNLEELIYVVQPNRQSRQKLWEIRIKLVLQDSKDTQLSTIRIKLAIG